ncbi:MAG TPA: hypothetical protein VF101_12345 [Gaiellaceae bacterium]
MAIASPTRPGGRAFRPAVTGDRLQGLNNSARRSVWISVDIVIPHAEHPPSSRGEFIIDSAIPGLIPGDLLIPIFA